MKKRYFVFLVLVVLIVVALFSNPSLERQKEIVQNEIMSFLKKEFPKEQASVDAGGIFGKLATNIGQSFVRGLLEPIVAEMIESDNYLLFSIPYTQWEGEKKVLGIAAFGTIFFFKNLDDLKDELLKSN